MDFVVKGRGYLNRICTAFDRILTLTLPILHQDEILMFTLGGLHAKHALNTTVGYLCNICSRTEDNHGNPFSKWPAEGPSGWKLTYSQQSDIKYTTIDVIPCLTCSFTLKTFIDLLLCQLYVKCSSYSSQNNSGSVTNYD
jgi:hypothetical protein